MIGGCNFKIKLIRWKGMEEPVDIIACKLMNKTEECVGEKNCILYQIYDKLDTIFIAKEHSKTMEGLAKK